MRVRRMGNQWRTEKDREIDQMLKNTESVKRVTNRTARGEM